MDKKSKNANDYRRPISISLFLLPFLVSTVSCSISAPPSGKEEVVVVFLNNDGTVYETKNIYRDETIVFPEQDPVPGEQKPDCVYTFLGWDKVVEGSSRIVYEAVFSIGSIGIVAEENAIVGYEGTATEVFIPSVWEGQIIEIIDSGVFLSAPTVRSVVISKGIVTIHQNALDGASIDSLYIPSTVRYISDYMFYNRAPSSIDLDPKNPWYTMEDSVFYDGALTKLFRFCGDQTEFEMPSSVTFVGPNAFYYTPVDSISFSNGLVSIERTAFAGTKLSSAVLPISLTSIGYGGFANCHEMVSIDLPSSLTAIGEYAFFTCNRLTSIILPESLVEVGANAFQHCSSLTIYCRAASQPEGWDPQWNSSNCPVVWGYQGD